jgi:hypothetical protein
MERRAAVALPFTYIVDCASPNKPCQRHPLAHDIR